MGSRHATRTSPDRLDLDLDFDLDLDLDLD